MCHHLEAKVGQIKKTGDLCGPHCQKQALHQESCGCKKGCKGRGVCKIAALKCTALCQCGGDCEI